MSEQDPTGELVRTQAQLALQAARIETLESELRDARASILGEVMQLGQAVRATVGERPLQDLLQSIVVAAQRLFQAAAASIALLDESGNELEFVVAAGAGAGEVVGMRFPAGRGIAGWAMMTGEALVVADVRRDQRFSQSFAQSTGYVPNAIMAAPLLADEDAIGVMEVLDRGAGVSFGLDDLELLGLFATPASVAVRQARLITGIGELLLAELEEAARGRGDGELASLAGLIRAADGEDRSLALAQLVYRISRQGERSRRLAEEILTAILRAGR